MLIYVLFILLALIITLTNSYILDRKITITSIGEFLVLFIVLGTVKFFDLNDFAMFYGVIIIFTTTNVLIRKKTINSYNVVFTIFMFTDGSAMVFSMPLASAFERTSKDIPRVLHSVSRDEV